MKQNGPVSEKVKTSYMTIEFNALWGEAPEHIINFLRNKLLEFYKSDTEISRAEIKFRK